MTKKILVADHSVTIQKIVAMAFEKEDAVVNGVSNGKDALNKMKKFQPDIVLADIDMPGLTGFELSKKIKNNPKFKSTKILLLISDFEDLDDALFKDSVADGHISKPFKSDDIIKIVTDLLSEKTAKPINETINLTPADMDKNLTPSETVFELSPENLIEDSNTTSSLTNIELEKTEDFLAKENSLDEMIKDVESLKETTDSTSISYDDNELGEVSLTQEDKIRDELDTAFQEIVKFGIGADPTDSPNLIKESIEPSDSETIMPEPEDLLEKMTPPLARGKGVSGPDLIQQSPPYFSKVSQELRAKDDLIIEEHIRQIFEDSLNTTIEKQIAGISNSITQSVQKAVREITPKIAREIIKEEIDKIKKS